jgi:uncharacterized protein YndB with AHSA1/START domain
LSDIKGEITIQAPVDAVFGYVSDMRNEREWNPDVRSIEKVTDGPVGVGTHYRAKWKGSPRLDVECVAFEPNESWTNRNGGTVAVTSSWRVSPTDGGSLLSSTMTVQGNGIGKIFAPMLVKRMQRGVPKRLEAIRQQLEASRDPGQPG